MKPASMSAASTDIDIGGQLAARDAALENLATLQAPLRGIGRQRRRRGLVALRFGDDEAEDLAGTGIAPMGEDAGQEQRSTSPSTVPVSICT